ncbi:MAG: ATP-dependent zinc metalloprotease FtsH [Deltaproteobacteria bacterium]|nr:MAG: ATP-dependent zinc metalloprotease FtsH [Deltaproteobacteria bacterium]
MNVRNRNKNKNKLRIYNTTLLVKWIFIGITCAILFQFFGDYNNPVQEKAFSDVVTALNEGQVKNLTIKGREYFGELQDGTRFYTIGERVSVWYPILNNAHEFFKTKYQFAPEDPVGKSQYIFQWVSLLVFFGIFFIWVKQSKADGKGFSFGKNRSRVLVDYESGYTFKDVAGIDECKQELQEIVSFLKDPERYTRLGAEIPKGVLLMGAPGTGKTLLAKAIAGEAGVPFFSVAGSDFVEMFVGVGASRVRDLFEQGKEYAPCIIFIDEIDAVGRSRGAGSGMGGNDEREQTLNQLLVEMDGFISNEGIIIIAATNRPDVLDPAILRPGRFDRRIIVPRPDLNGRESIFKIHTKNVPLDKDVNLEILARSTPGMSGADIKNLVNEAALIAAQKNQEIVNMQNFEAAREKIIMGTERRSLIMSRQEIENTAYHEAGHAIVSILIGHDVDPVHKVTIIPRGQALGLTMQLPTQDRYSISKTYSENQIAIMMGGRIAEELVFGEITSGAGNDFQKATDLAHSMVCDWGMSTMGPLYYGTKEEILLGKSVFQKSAYSELTAQEIDKEVKLIILEQYYRAKDILEQHMKQLEKVATALVEYETLDGIDVEILLEGKSLKKDKPYFKLKTLEDLEMERIEKGGYSERAVVFEDEIEVFNYHDNDKNALLKEFLFNDLHNSSDRNIEEKPDDMRFLKKIFEENF